MQLSRAQNLGDFQLSDNEDRSVKVHGFNQESMNLKAPFGGGDNDSKIRN